MHIEVRIHNSVTRWHQQTSQQISTSV